MCLFIGLCISIMYNVYTHISYENSLCLDTCIYTCVYIYIFTCDNVCNNICMFFLFFYVHTSRHLTFTNVCVQYKIVLKSIEFC